MKLIGIFLLMFSPQLLKAQNKYPVCAAYAYYQPVQQGAATKSPATENENSKPVSPVEKGNWFIFLAYKNSEYIVPYRIWIEGKPFRVDNEKLRTTPFVLHRPGLGFSTVHDTLVNITSDKIIQVHPTTALSSLTLPPVFDVATNAVAGNIVVEFYWQAKRFSCITRQIKKLEPLVLQ